MDARSTSPKGSCITGWEAFSFRVRAWMSSLAGFRTTTSTTGTSTRSNRRGSSHGDGDDFRIFLRLRRKKIVTVHYNTEHFVRYTHHGGGRMSSASYATRIAEIENAGAAAESEKALGDDRGFLWRLNSYWRFEQAWGGVIVELESVSLSRGVPVAVRWLVGRYLDSVPRESLEATLEPIQREAPRALSISSPLPSSLSFVSSRVFLRNVIRSVRAGSLRDLRFRAPGGRCSERPSRSGSSENCRERGPHHHRSVPRAADGCRDAPSPARAATALRHQEFPKTHDVWARICLRMARRNGRESSCSWLMPSAASMAWNSELCAALPPASFTGVALTPS